jgi:hypothetical protein
MWQQDINKIYIIIGEHNHKQHLRLHHFCD